MKKREIPDDAAGAGSREAGCTELIESINKAYEVYKLSEVYLKDVHDDYGKQKIARLRFEFARHELLKLISEAGKKGIKVDSIELMKKFLYGSPQ